LGEHVAVAAMRRIGVIFCAVLIGTARAQDSREAFFDPTAAARASAGLVVNVEASVPPMCYTKTEKRFNPCWTCHTAGASGNEMDDWGLQESYDFSDFGRTNRWSNLFVDRREAMKKISDDEITRWIRSDNYTPLREWAKTAAKYRGFRPDLDIDRGFDDDGFAKDGSGWRALRYQPFPGTFWPTNGSVDDVFMRLPIEFTLKTDARPSAAIAKANFSIVEALVAGDPNIAAAQFRFPCEIIDETAIGVDLDGNGRLDAAIDTIVGLPKTFVGSAAHVPVERGRYPVGTEFLHSVRYLDPDVPSLAAKRMKELRWSKKVRDVGDWSRSRAYEREKLERMEGLTPIFAGSATVGMENDFGWRLQGFIEDDAGRLRLQTEEEHLFCMGCHSHIGATVDQTFTMTRKLPRSRGWKMQSLTDLTDIPRVGHKDGEILTYFDRAGGGDELRQNGEILERFFPNGRLDRELVQRLGAAPGGLLALVGPSRKRALDLDRAYLLIVREQSFTRGRDAVTAPVVNVLRAVPEDTSAFDEGKGVWRDGAAPLDWSRDVAPTSR
jgi:hypothetical protein